MENNFQYQVSVHKLNDKANDNTWNISSGRQITVSVAPETGSSYNFRQEQDIFWFSKTTRMCSRSQKVTEVYVEQCHFLQAWPRMGKTKMATETWSSFKIC